eukprot:6461171-Amphidinium_carterae.1
MWCVQETHLPRAREDQAHAWASAHGLKLVHSPAIPTEAGGSQGGVAICVKKHIGVAQVPLDVPDTLRGRVVAARVNVGPPLTLVSVYLTTGLSDDCRFKQWSDLQEVIASLTGPILVAGDFQTDVTGPFPRQSLLHNRLLPITSGAPTCGPAWLDGFAL